DMIDAIGPEVVVFAGDVIYDRCSTAGADGTREFTELLRHLESDGKYALFIRGNNDNRFNSYDELVQTFEDSDRIFEISARSAVIEGVRFMGVPYGRERAMAESNEQSVDLLVAHAPYADRAWLFDIDAEIVVCGHYDYRIADVRGTAFVSLDCSPLSHAVIDREGDVQTIEYCYNRSGRPCRIRGERSSDHFDLDAGDCDPQVARQITEGKGPVPYGVMIDALKRAKEKMRYLSREEQALVLDRLLEIGVPRTHIEHYVGRSPPLHSPSH
ncbi:MAG TPA: metallophosphoesterase, partial [Methanomicrobiales archaeon]|nr:metallophosphoesterase [Methanomicrobiales archaeon]